MNPRSESLTDSSRFDVERADLDVRFDPLTDATQIPLSHAVRSGLSPRADILTIAREGIALAFLTRQMAYHHVAQGTLAGHPYLVSF